MSEKLLHIRMDLKKGETARSLERLVGAIEGVEMQADGASEGTDLLIYELGPEMDKDMASIQTQINQNSVSEVFLVSENLDSNVLLKAMRIGIKEVLATPFNAEEVNAALLRCKQRREELKYQGRQKAGTLVYVIASKGGVGSTTIAVNLALGLSTAGQQYSVALIDMNMLFGEVPLFLGLRPKHHWGEIAKNVHRLDRDYLKNCLHTHPSGLEILAAPRSFNPQEIAKEDVLSVFSMMKRIFDYLIIDGGQHLGGLSSSLLEMAEHILIISTLSLPCLANTNRILESFYDIGCLDKVRVKIIMNRYIKKSEISMKDAEESLKMKVFWSVPNDYQTALSAINRGQAIIEAAPGTMLARNLVELSVKLAGRDIETKPKGRGFLGQWPSKKAKPEAIEEE